MGTQVVYTCSFTMLRVGLLLVIGLTSYVRAADYTCDTASTCQVVDGHVRCAGDCGCADQIVDECSRPHPTTAVHVNSIGDCMANCQVFALEGRCKFIIYHYDNIDENCIIMNDDLDKYVGHCNVLGQALWSPTANTGLSVFGGCTPSGDGCANDLLNHCTKCTDCKTDKCSGFMLSGCLIESDPQETQVATEWGICENFARANPAATAVVFTREQQTCDFYGGIYNEDDFIYDGISRSCTTAFAALGTDLAACAPK